MFIFIFVWKHCYIGRGAVYELGFQLFDRPLHLLHLVPGDYFVPYTHKLSRGLFENEIMKKKFSLFGGSEITPLPHTKYCPVVRSTRLIIQTNVFFQILTYFPVNTIRNMDPWLRDIPNNSCTQCIVVLWLWRPGNQNKWLFRL